MNLRSLWLVGLCLCYACNTDIGFSKDYAQGMIVYQNHCQNCHGTKGEGLRNLIPPLTDTLYLKQNRAKLFHLVKNGVSGSIVVEGKTFDNAMPAQKQLTDEEVKQVLVYVTNSFGNKQGAWK